MRRLRERDTPGPERAPGSASGAGLAVVVLHELFVSIFGELERELGPAYSVITGSAAGVVDAFVLPAAVTVISSVRAEHPDSVIVVVSGSGGGEIGSAIDAGADQVVAECATVELAARVRAGLRRRAWERCCHVSR
ncbi:MAG: hypothetical protein ACYC91_16430 [Solirubrobacteraceae bacterium]